MLCPACAARLAHAVGLYRGELLSSVELRDAAAFEEWVLVRREALRQQALEALTRLAEHSEQADDYGALCRYARRQLELDPGTSRLSDNSCAGSRWRVTATRRSPSTSAADRFLADELGVEPDVETRVLYEQIRAGHLTPATRGVAAPRHNLTAPRTPFVGREAEPETIGTLQQPDTRLLTLGGAGGMGKTRLALELGRVSLDAYADGVFFVALAPLANASALSTTIAQAIGLTIHGGEPAVALLRYLRDKHMLLILDNFDIYVAAQVWLWTCWRRPSGCTSSSRRASG